MRTVLNDYRPSWPQFRIHEANRAIYGGGELTSQKRSRGPRAEWRQAQCAAQSSLRGIPGLLANYWLLTDSRRVALELDDASKLPAAAREAALDLIPSALEWLLSVAEEEPAAYDLQHGGDGKVYMRLRDECAECKAAADSVMWPASAPQFCSEKCALSWLEDRADDVPRMADLDEVIREAEEAATLAAKEAAEEDALEKYAGHVNVDSDDNPFMEVLRRYEAFDPTMTADHMAWRLDKALRIGLRL